jgi:hypothetical protein
MNRREFLKAITAVVAVGPELLAENAEARVAAPPTVIFEAKSWSDLPAVLKNYEALSDRVAGGTSRIFGYASIIKNHDNEKPAHSKDIPDESARLPGMEVAMNVLAAGEYEFRGTRGTYHGTDGKDHSFANVGIYAGLEPALTKDGFADGKNITASREDRRESLKAYIKRELGNPPPGITLDDLFDEKAAAKFEALKNHPKNEFGMYKFQVVNTQIEKDGKPAHVPAVSVATNEHSKFAAIGLAPMQTAQLILDGQGYHRKIGTSMVGGSALDYFKQSVVGVAKSNGLKQSRLTAIDEAVEKLAGIYAKSEDILQDSGLTEKERTRKLVQLVDDNIKELNGVNSPYFHKGENVNEREPVSEAEKALPENQMPKTAAEKFVRIAHLYKEGLTTRSLR